MPAVASDIDPDQAETRMQWPPVCVIAGGIIESHIKR